MPAAPPTFCLAESREHDGLRLAILSLVRFVPDARIVLYKADPSDGLRAWLSRFPQVRLVPAWPAGAYGWNCKPHVLIPLLESGIDEVVWVDSDAIAVRDPRPLLLGRPPEELTAAEEPASIELGPPGSLFRTTGWKLAPGRSLATTVNSCIMRVTPAHLPLLRRWLELLHDPVYVEWQGRPTGRPLAMLSDQDALNALLGSTEFPSVPVRLLRTGSEVIHSGGMLSYSLGDRVGGLGGARPTFVHAIAVKPWDILSDPAKHHSVRGHIYRVVLELSPYVAAARRFRKDVDRPCPWLDNHSFLSRMCRLGGFNWPPLQGLPFTLAATLAEALFGRRVRPDRSKLPQR